MAVAGSAKVGLKTSKEVGVFGIGEVLAGSG